MTTKDVLALALEALELSSITVDNFTVQAKCQDAITAIKQAQLKEKCAFPEVCPDHVHEFNALQALQAQQAQEPVDAARAKEQT